MIDILKSWWGKNPDLDTIKAKYASIYAAVEEMEQSFSKGGPVTWEQLGTYEVSTPERPIWYPTGKNCMTARLPDMDGKRIYYTICVAPEGEVGSFGWHWHPKTRETNTQLTKTAEHGGKKLPPFSVTVFNPGTEHDYILPPGGSLLTVFEKILQ